MLLSMRCVLCCFCCCRYRCQWHATAGRQCVDVIAMEKTLLFLTTAACSRRQAADGSNSSFCSISCGAQGHTTIHKSAHNAFFVSCEICVEQDEDVRNCKNNKTTPKIAVYWRRAAGKRWAKVADKAANISNINSILPWFSHKHKHTPTNCI